MTRRVGAAVTAFAAVALSPTAASAHLVGTRFGDFYAGMLHPLTALEHLLPWFALGLLAGLQDVRIGRWIPLAFCLGVLIGTPAAVAAPLAEPLTAATLASFVILGGLVAIGRRWPAALLIAIAGAVGLVHGYDNGLAMVPETNVLLFVAGVVTAGLLLVLLATAATLVVVRSRAWTRIAVRAMGSWIAAAGIMIAGLNLAS